MYIKAPPDNYFYSSSFKPVHRIMPSEAQYVDAFTLPAQTLSLEERNNAN